ncbi:hypothetical protein ACLOJK_002448 [Asimina triloba]
MKKKAPVIRAGYFSAKLFEGSATLTICRDQEPNRKHFHELSTENDKGKNQKQNRTPRPHSHRRRQMQPQARPETPHAGGASEQSRARKISRDFPEARDPDSAKTRGADESDSREKRDEAVGWRRTSTESIIESESPETEANSPRKPWKLAFDRKEECGAEGEKEKREHKKTSSGRKNRRENIRKTSSGRKNRAEAGKKECDALQFYRISVVFSWSCFPAMLSSFAAGVRKRRSTR